LRGRVGRGEHESYCVLATDLDLSRASEDQAVALAAERLQAVEASGDGFKLSIVDLRQRGEGQLFGARQSGMPQLRLARVLQHKNVVLAARKLAEATIDRDPDLRAYEHIALEREMRDRFPERALDVVQSG
jgi:ATP-dependent DNA helicase RecG